MIEINAAIDSARALLGLVKGAIDARDDAKLRNAVIELQDRLLSVTITANTLQAQLDEAKAAQLTAQRKITEMERQFEERALYQLDELRPGAFAYRSKASADGNGPPLHYLCQPCYDKGVKAILRYGEGGEWTNGTWTCPSVATHAIEDTQRSRP